MTQNKEINKKLETELKIDRGDSVIFSVGGQRRWRSRVTLLPIIHYCLIEFSHLEVG